MGADKEAVTRAVQHSGQALQFASSELRMDRDVAIVAVGQDWRALEFVYITLHDDLELLKIGAKQDGRSLMFASEELKQHPELIRVALDNKWRSIEHTITPIQVLNSKTISSKAAHT